MASKKNIQYNDEIDLSEIILTLWDNKLKIFLITAVAVILMFSFQNINKVPTIIKIEASTEIKPISVFDSFKFETYNYYLKKIRYEDKSLNLKPITKAYLLSLFREKMGDRSLSREAIKKFSLIDPNDYNNSNEYENAVMKLASTIKIKERSVGEIDILFVTDNKKKWEKALKLIESNTNKHVQKYLNENFDSLIKHVKKLKKYEVDDIEVEITESFQNYETTISNRLIFLNEQAQIARSINLPKNTSDNAVLTPMINTKLDNSSSYYMRGYEMIEKEIELIQKRTNKKPFIEKLIVLENRRDNILKDKSIERLENLYANSPVVKSDNFIAAKIDIDSTIYTKLNFNKPIAPMLFLAGLLGLIFGMTFVLVTKAAIKRK